MIYNYKCDSCQTETEIKRKMAECYDSWECKCGNKNDGRTTKQLEPVAITGNLEKGLYNNFRSPKNQRKVNK